MYLWTFKFFGFYYLKVFLSPTSYGELQLSWFEALSWHRQVRWCYFCWFLLLGYYLLFEKGFVPSHFREETSAFLMDFWLNDLFTLALTILYLDLLIKIYYFKSFSRYRHHEVSGTQFFSITFKLTQLSSKLTIAYISVETAKADFWRNAPTVPWFISSIKTKRYIKTKFFNPPILSSLN